MSTAMNRLAARRGIRLVLTAIATLWLAACSVPDSINPVSWYRDSMGLSEDDPPEDTRNSGNLAAGNTRDYPNLATVPPTPTRALSTAERDALTQRLISDRANAKYIDEQLRGGPAAAAAPPPAPAAVASAAPAAPAAAATPPAADVAPAPTAPPAPPSTAAAAPPPAATPPAAPSSRSVSLSAPPPNPAASAPAAAPTPPPAPPPASAPAAATPAAPARSAPWVSLSAPPPSGTEQQAAASPPTPAAPAVDANGQPRESPLTSPTVRSVPEPETPRAPPPPPSLAQGGKSPAARTQVAARTPASAPPPATGAPIAQVTFADNSARLSPADRRIVGEVIPLQRQTGGAIRVVGYASKGGGTASQQLANFRIALDRANAVASVLAQSGVAPDQILVETAPPTGENGIAANRAEIFLEN
jgi:outer membrane protein OmpA-like peptidoglycan-associated protein